MLLQPLLFQTKRETRNSGKMKVTKKIDLFLRTKFGLSIEMQNCPDIGGKLGTGVSVLPTVVGAGRKEL